MNQETQAKLDAQTAPKVTEQQLKDLISHKLFFTAHDGVDGAEFNRRLLEANGDIQVGSKWAKERTKDVLDRLTFCVLVLKNGFTVTGESACVSPENFIKEVGEEIAYKNAFNKLWQLEGYTLNSKLHEQKERLAKFTPSVGGTVSDPFGSK